VCGDDKHNASLGTTPKRWCGAARTTHGVLFYGGIEANYAIVMLLHAGKKLIDLHS
jgi:hypothetical protein